MEHWRQQQRTTRGSSDSNLFFVLFVIVGVGIVQVGEQNGRLFGHGADNGRPVGGNALVLEEIPKALIVLKDVNAFSLQGTVEMIQNE